MKRPLLNLKHLFQAITFRNFPKHYIIDAAKETILIIENGDDDD